MEKPAPPRVEAMQAFDLNGAPGEIRTPDRSVRSWTDYLANSIACAQLFWERKPAQSRCFSDLDDSFGTDSLCYFKASA